MRSIAFAAALYLAVAAGTAYAAEDNLMAMRGRPPEGASAVNRFQAEARRETQNIPEYIEWKDSCVPGPIHLADGTVEWDGNAGFNLTPRFVARGPGSSPGAFLDEFVKDLARFSDKR